MSRQYRGSRIIWAAGFFDGEGCISIIRNVVRRGRPVEHYFLQITAFQNVREPLDVLHALFGGSVKPRDNGWIWSLSGHSTVTALKELSPFLLVKKAQAEAAILFQSRKVKRGGKYEKPVIAKELDRLDFAKVRDLKLVSNRGG
jgi:hypothetical protein